jgi:spore coat polysaccharide biosynthesis protein SpsF (cytidylyltransferase family)/aryl-alcohol dehydrogenase-like predicted oxidoreductase
VVARRRIVLQARTSSTRLPGKVLLPICGLPMAVLAAKRAGQDGTEVVVATSDDPSDDALAETAKRHGLKIVRGPLDDVLARFLLATQDMSEDDICIRFTADNVFPNSDFANRLAGAVEQEGHGWAGFSGGAGGLPYGLAGEAFRVGLLRQADRSTQDAQDREHVSPWITRQAGRYLISMPGDPSRDFSGLRCTVDTLEDYRTVSAALAGLKDPVGAPYLALCHRLADWCDVATPPVPARIVAGDLQASLVLGGVQFGLNYGIANRTGAPDDATLDAILTLAERSGVTHLDTAAVYGDSEQRIGAALTARSPLRIITKLPPEITDGDPAPYEATERVHAAVAQSLAKLGRSRLDAVLLHRSAHFRAISGAIWTALCAEQNADRIGRIGVSIYSPKELLPLLDEPSMGLVQLPFNILDRRWLAADVQEAIARRPDVILHGRSALLQGLLTLDDPARWPCDRALAESCIAALRGLARDLGRRGVVDLCFAYARSQTWLAGIVVGAETAAQMAENIELFRTPALTPEHIAEVRRRIPEVPESLLDPSRWPRS